MFGCLGKLVDGCLTVIAFFLLLSVVLAILGG